MAPPDAYVRPRGAALPPREGRRGPPSPSRLVSLFSPRVADVGAVRRSWDWRRPFRHVCVPARAGVVLDTRPWAKLGSTKT